MKIRKPREASAVVMMLTATIACTPQQVITPIESSPAPNLPQKITAFLEQQPVNSPLFLVIGNDNSGSRKEHRIQPLSLEQLERAIVYINQYGGEIAFLGICDDSNYPALRVKIPSPPLTTENDFQRVSVPDPPNTKSINTFEVPQVKKEYETKRAESKKKQAQNNKILSQKQTEFRQWQAHSSQQLQEFKAQLKPELERPATCQQSDINGAIGRGNLIFNEEQVGWSKPPKKFALFITDAIHTTDRQPEELAKDTELLLVNGSGSSGVFSEGTYKHFESVPSAMSYLVHTVQSNES